MTPHARTTLLLISCLLVLVPWLAWRLPSVRRVAPLAVIQIMAGLALGPTGLGAAFPEAQAALFSPPVLASINGLAIMGVLLFVFVSGLHLDGAGLRAGAGRLGPMAVSSVAVPLLLGVGAGWVVALAVPGATGLRGDKVLTAAAIGICVSVTALPVLAAILREMGLIEGRLGQTALALAALNDAALWLMIAVLLALARGSAAAGGAVLGLTALWLAAMLFGVRPLLGRMVRRGAGEHTTMVAALSVCLASAAVTESFDLGYLIGGFVAGAIMPASARQALLARVEPLTGAVLLPFFFVATGLRARIDAGSAVFLGVFALLSAAAILGKVLGTAVPARRGMGGWRPALALGALMQTKGLMEVVVLAVLLDAGLIGTAVYSALVAMAVLCTLITTPLVRLALRPG